MKQWEYRVITQPTESEANRLGNLGWELVGFTGVGFGCYGWFKRAKEA